MDGNITRVCGIDCGSDKSVAVAVDSCDYQENDPVDLFHLLRFHELEPDEYGLQTLLEINADLYIIEPTGSYNRKWTSNLRDRGKRVLLVAHEVLSSYRVVCGWQDKDDPHDALALACYGWQFHSRPYKFNRERDPLLETVLNLYLVQKKLATDYVKINNRARQLLDEEMPEVAKRKSTVTSDGAAPPLWAFISGRPCPKREQRKLTKILPVFVSTA